MSMTVIVRVDNSEASKAALRLAAQEARWRQASLVAVSAYELPISPPGGFPSSAMHTRMSPVTITRTVHASATPTDSGRTG
jgi:nucleotide-binding universal stress UspA family protein